MFEMGEWVKASSRMLVNLASTCVVGLYFFSGALIRAEVLVAEPSDALAQTSGALAHTSGILAEPSGIGVKQFGTTEQVNAADHLRGQGQSEKRQGEKLPEGQVALGPSSITAMAYSVSDDLIYAVDGRCDGLIIINETLRLRFHVGPLGFSAVCGLTFDSEGQMFAVEGQGDQLLKVDPITGEAKCIGPLGFSSVQSLACDRLNRLYGVDTVTDQLVRIDKQTGHASAVASLDVPSIFSLAFVQGEGLYGVDIASSLLYKIDVQTGACMRLSPTLQRCCETHGLATCPDGRLLSYSVRHNLLCELNWNDGTIANKTQIRELSVSRFVTRAIPDAIPTRILIGLALLTILVATCIQCGRLVAHYVGEAWQQTRDVFAKQQAPS
jgi:hypothetical protein